MTAVAVVYVSFHYPPTDLEANVDESTVYLTWTAPDVPETEILLGYRVWRGEYLLTTSSILETAYEDENVPNGEYIYSVYAIYETGQSVPATKEVEVDAEIPAPLHNPPTGLSADVNERIVSLSWTAPVVPETETLLGYKVWRDELPLTLEYITDTFLTDNDVPNGLHLYSVRAIYETGQSVATTTTAVVDVGTTEQEIEGSWQVTALGRNYPNPFNPSTTIVFTVGFPPLPPPSQAYGGQTSTYSSPPTAHRISIDIFNIRGQKIRSLVDKTYPTGGYRIVWNGTDDFGRDVPSGIYLYRLKTNEFSQTKRMLLLK